MNVQLEEGLILQKLTEIGFNCYEKQEGRIAYIYWKWALSKNRRKIIIPVCFLSGWHCDLLGLQKVKVIEQMVHY